MEFDYEKYAAALDKFIVRAEQITTVDSPKISEAMEDVCRLLRIARAEGFFYESPQKEVMGDVPNYFRFYDSGEECHECYQLRELTGGGNVAFYKIYKVDDGMGWSPVEYEKVKVFTKLLFTFNGRARVMNLAHTLMFTDRETEIYNHTYFMRTLSQYIADNTIGKYCACFFNLKRFSIVNQHVGRKTANVVMKKFLDELNNMLDESECLCRIGGDNFVALFRKNKKDDVIDYLKGQPVIYDETTCNRVLISAHAGYYMIPEGFSSPEDIMDCVMNALNICKSTSAEYVFFNDDLMAKASDAKYVESAFPEAIKNQEFKVYYQPKTNLENNKMNGAEALCRWFRNGEVIAPFRFIPILEKSKAICTLDFYMLEQVCRDIRRWLDEGKKVVTISVNFSRRHLGDIDLLERIISIIDKHNVPHEYIEIELTETTVDVDYRELRKVVEGLSKAGVSTSVDDFGIGYSSLNLIRELPWNVLKIDRSFIPTEDEKDGSDHVMLKHLIAMANDMGLKCIAEGVETIEQVNLLKEYNCFLAQGFYFDKPLPVEEFEKRLDGLE